MATTLRFDESYNPLPPTFVLATRTNKKLGIIHATNIQYVDSLYTDELSFQVYKYSDGVKENLWEQIKNFKTLWCKEWDEWFSIEVEIDEDDDTVKNITAKSLGETELGQVMLYDIEINTETDISRDDYVVTKIYNPNNTEGSLLHRMTEKVPHYSIGHVDDTIASLQRTFEFDDISLYDALEEVCEELDALLIIDSSTNEIYGTPMRTINLYDLSNTCEDCLYRGSFTDECPECGSTNIIEGYGDDTTIFISKENLGDDITFTTDTDAVKNCFKLIAGDDLMTATVRNCNPTGTDYIMTFSDEDKEDMPDELVEAIESYDELYDYYLNDYEITVSSLISEYNSLISKYSVYDSSLAELVSPIVGYTNLMMAQYEVIDMLLYLESELMPDASLQDTDAATEAAKLTMENLSTVSVSDVSYISESTASSNVLAFAKVIVDSRYQVKVKESSLEQTVWTGNFTVTNYSDETDTATSEIISVVINDDYENYIRQKIEKTISSEDDADLYDISGLFSSELSTFKLEIKKYCLDRLNSFYDSCQSCLDVLIEQGVGDKDSWDGEDPNLYDDLYYPYYQKLQALEAEISLREDEIETINDLQDALTNEQTAIQDALNFEAYLGTDLYYQFLMYRREDSFTNSNYISDGLTNAEIFERAQEFIQVASAEIYKSANLQHSISSTLKNLLVMEEFKPLVKHFKTGNWLRLRVDDEVYKLRLLEYEIDFEDLDNLTVTFSDVSKVKNGYTDVESVLQEATSMATSYSFVSKQASEGSSSLKIVDHWVNDGLDLTNQKIISSATGQTQTWDSHGMLFRKQTDETEEYDDTQMKIINSTLAITDDGWESVKTALGEYYYKDPTTGEYVKAYGLIAETIVGELICGEKLIISGDGSVLDISGNSTIKTVNDDIANAVTTMQTYADTTAENAIAKYDTTVSATYETKEDAATRESTLSSAIVTAQESAEAYADGAIAKYDTTVSATYETQSAAAQILIDAKSYADGADADVIITAQSNAEATISDALDLLLYGDGGDEEDSTQGLMNSINALAENNEELYNILNGGTDEDGNDVTGLIESVSNLTVSVDEISSQVTDTALFLWGDDEKEGIEAKMSSLIEQSSTDLQITFDESLSTVSDNISEVSDQVYTLQSYFNFSSDGLKISISDSEIALLLSNDRISFLGNKDDNSSDIAFISDSLLYIYDGRFLNTLRVGNFKWVPRTTGHLSLLYSGDEAGDVEYDNSGTENTDSNTDDYSDTDIEDGDDSGDDMGNG